jgi:RHS repeat-associated protein
VIVEKYLWADLTTLLAVYDGSDNLVQRFTYAVQRMPVSMTMGATKYYLHYDQVGSLRAISDTDGTIIKEITYDTYGNILTDSNTSFKVPFGFAGGLYDADTGLTRFGYRDYDAATGKWTAKDPIGFAGGDSNLYGYVLQDPVNLVDSSGLVDENLIPTNSASNWYLHHTLNTYNPSNWYTVATHGYKGWFSGNINTIANNARQSGKNQILLIACQQGDGDMGNMAQDLANRSNMPVQYTDGNVNVIPFFGPLTLYPYEWKTLQPQRGTK